MAKYLGPALPSPRRYPAPRRSELRWWRRSPSAQHRPDQMGGRVNPRRRRLVNRLASWRRKVATGWCAMPRSTGIHPFAAAPAQPSSGPRRQ